MNHRSPHKLIVRILAILLVLMFVMTLASQIFLFAFATEAEHQENLNALYSQQESLEEEQASLEEQLSQLTNEKKSLAEKLVLLEDELANLTLQIENTQALIEQYNAQIAQTKEDIATAQADYDQYYELFYTRLMDIRKTGAAYSGWGLVFSAKSMSELFTILRQTRFLAETDQYIMEQLVTMKDELSSKEAELEEQLTAQNQELKKLNTQKKKLSSRSKEYSETLKQVKKNITSYDARLTALREERGQVEISIANEKELIRTEREAEAARIYEEAQRELDAVETENAPVYAAAEDEDTSSQPKTADKTTEAEEEAQTETEASSSKVTTVAETSPEKTTQTSEPVAEPASVNTTDTATAAAVISYAQQFLGNPYVWGGTSLTNGCDCSGFVQQVYAHFGISLPRTSYEMRVCDVGYRVEISDLLPGDLVCYNGHVGLYVGNGQMINALGTKYGIVICSIYSSGRTLICGRRVL